MVFTDGFYGIGVQIPILCNILYLTIIILVVEEDLMNDVEEQSEQDSSNLIIRDYFPEVWLFEDYKLG